MKNQAEILFFNSAAGIWSHTSSDALLLSRLSATGATVSTISCDGFFEGLCSVRMSRGRTLEDVRSRRGIDCNDCTFTSQLTSLAAKSRKDARYLLGSFLSPSARAEVEKFLLEWKALGNRESLALHGVPVAKFAAYEIALKYKSWEVATSGEGTEDYAASVFDTALTVIAAKEFFRLHHHFSAVVVRSPHYSVNRAFAWQAREAGIKVVFLDGSPNLSEDYTHVMVWDWGNYASGNPAIDYFPQHAVEPGKRELQRIRRHLKSLERAKSHKVYSSPKSNNRSALASLSADTSKRTSLLALSSMDESIAAIKTEVNPRVVYPGSVFNDQYEWVAKTIAWFKLRPHLQLIIRVHPREFPNKRDLRVSPAGRRWEEELKNLPPNVFLNHPEDGISLYDLFSEIDVVVTGWSSAGLEAAINGVTLITYDASLPGYPSSIGLSGTSELEYFNNLTAALEGDAVFDHRATAFRWLNLLMNSGTSRVGGRFLASNRNVLPRWLNLILEGLDRYLFFVSRPVDLLRGILFEPSDRKFQRVILEGKKDLFQ